MIEAKIRAELSLGREAHATSAFSGGVGVTEDEPRLGNRGDPVDLHTVYKRHAKLVDKDTNAVYFEDAVVVIWPLFHSDIVHVSGTSTFIGANT